MILIIISIILSLITAGVLGYDFLEEEYKIRPRMILGAMWLIIIVFGCFTKVGANQVGVIYDPVSGGIQNTLLNEGFKSKSPLSKVYKISTAVQDLILEEITVQTKEGQWLNTIIQIQARVDKNSAFEYFKKYQNKSLKDLSSILKNTIQKEIENITTQYNIMDCLGEKKNEIVNKVSLRVKEELLKDGILVERVILVDMDAGVEIEQAIAKEAVAKKEAETAKYLKEKATLEGDAKIEQAKKDGEAKVIAAQKEKEANTLLTQSLTPAILEQQKIEAYKEMTKAIKEWKPQVIGDVNSLLDISKFVK